VARSIASTSTTKLSIMRFDPKELLSKGRLLRCCSKRSGECNNDGRNVNVGVDLELKEHLTKQRRTIRGAVQVSRLAWGVVRAERGGGDADTPDTQYLHFAPRVLPAFEGGHHHRPSVGTLDLFTFRELLVCLREEEESVGGCVGDVIGGTGVCESELCRGIDMPLFVT
jgi:hypothetical protein